MPAAKPRSVFWVVTTIVSNAIAYTVLVMMIGSCVAGMLLIATTPVQNAVVAVAWTLLSCAAATQHALHFVRTRAMITEPRACLVPTLATFAATSAGVLIVIVQLAGWLPRTRNRIGGQFDVAYIGVLGSMWFGANAVFAVLVYRFFQKLTAEHARGFEIQPAQRVEPVEQTDKNEGV